MLLWPRFGSRNYHKMKPLCLWKVIKSTGFVSLKYENFHNLFHIFFFSRGSEDIQKPYNFILLQLTRYKSLFLCQAFHFFTCSFLIAVCPKFLVSYLVFGFKYLYFLNHQKHNSVREQVASSRESRTEAKLMVKAIRKVPGWRLKGPFSWAEVYHDYESWEWAKSEQRERR